MANIKPIEQSSEKWVRKASVAGADYEAGVKNPRRPWATSAIAASANYKQGVIAAANAGRYEAGVKAVGDEKWKRNSSAKGPNRFAEGVSLAKEEWQKGFRPYQDALSALKLPSKGPKGSAQNLQRVASVAQTLRGVFEKKGGR